MKAERSTTIACPPDVVFSFVSDPRNLPKWQPAVSEVTLHGDEVAVGSRFEESRQFVGKRFRSTVEVTELEPDRVFAVHVTNGPVPITVRHVFEPDGDGTRLTLAAEAQLTGLKRLGGTVMVKAAERDAEQNLARLKHLLEEQGP
jgi:carbon monoxide dehydrogenase subunit G